MYATDSPSYRHYRKLIGTEDLKQLLELLTNHCSLETTECCLLLAKNKILCTQDPHLQCNFIPGEKGCCIFYLSSLPSIFLVVHTRVRVMVFN